MQRGNGAVIGKQNTPTTSVATGVWALNEVQRAVLGGNWPAAVQPDPYFEYNTLLLHGNGTNGAQNNTFLDSSTNNFTITRNGNTTQGTFSPYGSNWSNFFNGSSDYLNAPASAAFAFGTGAWTIEAWVYVTTLQEIILFDTRSSASTAGVGARIDPNGTLFYSGSANNSLTSSAITANTWNHVAWVYDGTTLSGYINGVRGGTATPAFNITQNNGVIGRVGFAAAGYMAGYISNLRVVKGSAVYSGASFTPPTAPLTAITNTSLLTCADNRFIDDSANNFAITRSGSPSVQRFSPFNPPAAYSAATIGGSGYFDGSGDYLSVADSAALELGGSDFCIEGWYYPLSFGSNLVLVGKRANTTSTGAIVIYANSGSGALTFYASANGSSYFWSGSTIGTMVLNQWNHFAVYRSGSNWYGSMNGVVSSMGSSANSIVNNTDAYTIGGDTNGNYANGYIASTRIVIGSAVYGASNFTPPTAPLTAITNTQLLCNFTNGGIIDNAMMNDLETVGNAQISTAQSKFGGGSMYFDGSGDWLVAPSTPNLALNGGAFTIEAWVYPTTLSGTKPIVETRTSASSTSGYAFLVNSSGYLDVYSNGFLGASSTALTANTWSHVALVRTGTGTNQTTYYINGTAAGTITMSGNFSDATSTVTRIGGSTSAGEVWVGYIDDLRITKGYARYTANFTPPTAPFPDQ